MGFDIVIITNKHTNTNPLSQKTPFTGNGQDTPTLESRCAKQLSMYTDTHNYKMQASPRLHSYAAKVVVVSLCVCARACVFVCLTYVPRFSNCGSSEHQI